MKDFYCNASQSAHMKPWGSLHTLCQGADLCDCIPLLVLCVLLFICLLYVCLQEWVGWRGSQIYSFAKDAVLVPEDHIGVVGISIKRHWQHGCSASQLRSLGGEAYGAPCIALIAFAFWSNISAPWLAAKPS